MVQNEQGQWRVIEVRTGQDRWEDTGLIAAALKTTVPERDCDGSQLPDRGGAEPGNRRARCIIAAMLGVPLPSDDVRIKDVSQLGIPLASASSAIVVARVRLELRLENDRGSWRISAVRSGSGDWVGIDNLPGALDEAKRSRAGEELAALARALEKYRSDRGFYVSSDKEPILIDHLSPRYLSRVIRVDPWHNPYLYQGERDRFELRSSGPDGKENTQDDIVVSGPSR
jgi:general secretion pathway protein G